jgi:hypothetical protein
MPDLPPDYVAARDRLGLTIQRHRPGTKGWCDMCGLPLTLGQDGRHYMCREIEAVDQAEADWMADEGIDPDQPPLFPPAPRGGRRGS